MAGGADVIIKEPERVLLRPRGCLRPAKRPDGKDQQTQCRPDPHLFLHANTPPPQLFRHISALFPDPVSENRTDFYVLSVSLIYLNYWIYYNLSAIFCQLLVCFPFLLKFRYRFKCGKIQKNRQYFPKKSVFGCMPRLFFTGRETPPGIFCGFSPGFLLL